MIQYSRSLNLGWIIELCSDANVNHVTWESTEVNKSGEELLKFIIGSQLDILRGATFAYDKHEDKKHNYAVWIDY